MDFASEINQLIVQQFVLDANDNKSYSKQDILATINYLIEHDMQKLLFILYRVDVAEEKIRASLSNSMNEDAAEIIYQHIHDREVEKAASRKKYSSSGGFLDF